MPMHAKAVDLREHIAVLAERAVDVAELERHIRGGDARLGAAARLVALEKLGA